MTNPPSITIRINSYSVAKLQAVKLLRSFHPSLGLKGAKGLLDLVDMGHESTFEIDRFPGARLALLRSEGLDMEVVVPETSTESQTILFVEGYGEVTVTETIEHISAHCEADAHGFLHLNDGNTLVPVNRIVMMNSIP